MAARILVDAVDLATKNIDLFTFTPSDSDLGEQIGTASFVIDEDVQVTPKVPAIGMSVETYDDDGVTLLFGGRISDMVHIETPIRRKWKVMCQDHNVRTFETATGSLTFTGLASDREMVIAIFRDGLKATVSSPAGALVDDPIITANEPDWTGVKATAFLSGTDFSYMSTKNAMDLLADYVPDVHWRIGPDRVLSYGDKATPAPFVVGPARSATAVPLENYEEEVFIGDHRNKMRRGGFDTAEATAYDEVSIAKLGRVLEDPYRNDEAVPEADIRRRAYAELASRRMKRRIRFKVHDKGLKAGQLLDVIHPRLGPGTIPSPLINVYQPLMARSNYGALVGERDRFLVQTVRTRPLGRQNYVYEVAVGDYMPSFAKGIAKLVISKYVADY